MYYHWFSHLLDLAITRRGIFKLLTKIMDLSILLCNSTDLLYNLKLLRNLDLLHILVGLTFNYVEALLLIMLLIYFLSILK